MQKLSVTCWNKNLFNKLTETNVNKIIIGINGLSCRFNNYFNIDDLDYLCKNKKNKKISISINSFFHEEQIPFLQESLLKISSYPIDEIIFQDFAVPQIMWENNIKINLNYNPETLNTNFGQFPFMIENGFKSVTLARELLFQEIQEISKNKLSLELEMQIHGFTYFMHSAWPLISNFSNELDDKNIKHKKCKFYKIREDTRILSNIIYEDEQGTHMFSGFVLCGITKIKEIKDVDFFKIDSIFRSEKWTLNMVKIYSLYLENRINLKQALSLIKYIEKDNVVSESFLGKIKEMPHFREGDDNEK